MKKEIIYYSILTLAIALLLVFETNLFSEESKYVSKVVEVEEFERLDIDLDCDIYVSLGEEQKVVFEGPAAFLDQVETQLVNGVLKITHKQPGLLSKIFGDESEETSAGEPHRPLPNRSILY